MMRTTVLLALFGLSAIALTPSTAWAGDVEAAEHRRLSEEMDRLSGRNAWPGVERAYQQLLALEDKGEVITLDELYLAAQAAQNLGNIAAMRERLVKYIAQESDPQVEAWLEGIDRDFASVDLKTVDREAEASLVREGTIFATDQRAAVDFAAAQVQTKREFKGLLPAGNYTFTSGKVTQTFTLEAGADKETVLVKLTPSQGGDGGGGALSYVGPRLDLGGAFTLAGEPSADADSPIQAGAFRGAGARLGVGVEAGFKRGFGVFAEVGYHNMVSPPNGDNSLHERWDSLHMGYGMVGPTMRFGDVWTNAAVIYGAGVAGVSGLSDDTSSLCPYGEVGESDSCAAVSNVEQGEREFFPLSGSIKAPGLQVSGGYAFLDIGKSLKGGVTVTAGAMFDSHRSYPWGQVAFTVGPVPQKGS